MHRIQPTVVSQLRRTRATASGSAISPEEEQVRTPILFTLAFCAFALSASGMQAQDYPADLMMNKIGAFNPLVGDIGESRAIAIADLDNDGHNDAFIANNGENNAIYWGSGNGTMARDISAQSIVTDGGLSVGVALADVDLDGDIDVFVTNSTGQANNLYLNQKIQGSARVFTKVTTGAVVTDSSNTRNARFADVDQDGDPDLYVCNFQSQDNFFYRNDLPAPGAAPVFTRITTGDFVTNGGSSYSADFADIDADGDLDLYVTNHDAGTPVQNFLYRNDTPQPAGTPITFTRILTGDAVTDSDSSLCCGFADIDGQNGPDLFVGNVNQPNRMYVNDGNGNFTSVSLSPITDGALNSIACTWFDAEGDGDPDLAVGNRNGASNFLYLNLGDGTFQAQNFGPMSNDTGNTYGVATGSLNANVDNTVEIVFVNQGETNFMYRNNDSQWREIDVSLNPGQPRLGGLGNFQVGEVVHLKINGADPNLVDWLLLSLGQNPQPLMGGVLVPSIPFALIQPFPVNALGQADLSDQIPPGFGGLEFYVQVWAQYAVPPLPGVTHEPTNAMSIRTP